MCQRVELLGQAQAYMRGFDVGEAAERRRVIGLLEKKYKTYQKDAWLIEKKIIEDCLKLIKDEENA